MIKIYIDNEEVVSNSNLQIKEEMLSTSSTILKNCYPASWEIDKDYVSRYYFPKDYAKCKIKNIVNSKLPNEYQQVEYIESTGTQYIDTGYYGNENTKIESKIAITNLSGSGNIGIYGSQNGNTQNSNAFALCISNQQTYIFPQVDNEARNVIANLEFELNKTYNFIHNKHSWYYDGTLGATWTNPSSFTTNNTITIFKINGSTYEKVQAKVYEFKIYENNTLIKNMIPCYKKADSTIGMYDLVNGVFYENDGTGTFAKGNNVNETEELIFCGCVKNTGKISLNPREPHYVDLQILDFKTMLSEGETLNYVIDDKTIIQAIGQVIDTIKDYGFVLGDINIQNPNEKLYAYSTLDKTAYDVFQYIAEITQSRWTTRMIDENNVAIDFFDPLLIGISETIESTEQYYEDNNIVDINFNYSTQDYRNKQIMTSDEVVANISQTELIVSNGYTTNYICQNKIGTIISIKVNNVDCTFITKSQKDSGLSADFIYKPGETTLTASETYNVGDRIVIVYYPIVRGREISLNPQEISRVATQIGRKGTISRYENRNDATSSAELSKIGQSYIRYKGSAEIILKVKTTHDILNVGDLAQYNSVLDELNTIYMVKDKVIDMYLNANEVFYTYELTSNFNSENAINYFDNQRAKAYGNLGEGETITRDIDIENTATIIFYDTTIQEAI